MALIAMCVFDTEENGRTVLTRRTIESILDTVTFDKKHRLIIVDNKSCRATQDLLNYYESEYFLSSYWMNNHIVIIRNSENIGTARAINKAWMLRESGEHCIKMDNDIFIHSSGWVDEMEEAIRRNPLIGQVGLKRNDLWEYPTHPEEDFKSELIMLPHVAGERWQIVEKVKHVIGSCVMHSSALLDRVGYLYQPSLYGYDDVIMSHRTYLAGFYSCFLPHIAIDHIDPGTTPYQSWKEKHSGEQTQKVIELVREMHDGKKPIYYGAE